MTSYDFGTILLVPFPFTDQTGVKKRPAVVINSTIFGQRYNDIVLMAITSQIKKPLNFGELEIVEWQKAGLLKPSIVKPVFTTVESSIVVLKLGNLEATDEENLRKTIQKVLG